MPTKNDIKYLSATALDLFEQCERRYWHERILGRKQPMTAPMVVGNVYHKVLQQWMKHFQLGEREVAEILSSQNKQIAAVGVDFNKLVEEVGWNLERLDRILGDMHPIAIEQRWSWGEQGYRGVTDVVEKDRIIDWKILTGKRRRSARDVEFSPQFALYRLYHKVDKAMVVEVPRDDREIRVHQVEFGEREPERWLSYLSTMREAILSRGENGTHFKRTKRSNPLCSPMWCPFWDQCYMPEKA